MKTQHPSRHLSLAPWLHEHMDFLRHEWSVLRDDRLMSFQQFMELVVQFAVDNLTDPDYVKNFQFTTRGRGRPRKSKLASPLSETVSEDPLVEDPLEEEQPHASKDEAGTGSEDHPPPSGGRTSDDPR